MGTYRKSCFECKNRVVCKGSKRIESVLSKLMKEYNISIRIMDCDKFELRDEYKIAENERYTFKVTRNK
jgi:hypothetical protein